MRKFVPLCLQESVRNRLEISDKGIVSYIPFKFAFKTLIVLALCQKLPTAYFSHSRMLSAAFSRLGEFLHHWCIFAPAYRFSSATPQK